MAQNSDMGYETLATVAEYHEKLADIARADSALGATGYDAVVRQQERLAALARARLDKLPVQETEKARRERETRETLTSILARLDALEQTVARLVENDAKTVAAVNTLADAVDKILKNYDPLRK